MALLKWMGVSQSEKPVVNDVPIGLENFGNTCYCNSILQALYYCRPFRDCVLNYHSGSGSLVTHYPLSPMTPSFNQSGSQGASYFGPQAASAVSPGGPASARNHQRDSSTTLNGNGASQPPQQRSNIVGVLLPNGGGPDPDSAPQESMFLCLQDLFLRIQNHSKKTLYFTPTAFVAKVKKENELFRSSMHQDAHEFLMFIINTISEDVEADFKRNQKELEDSLPKSVTNGSANGSLNGVHLTNGSNGANGSATAAAGVNGSATESRFRGSSEVVGVTTLSGDEVRIKINGADINAASTSSTHGNGRGGESVGDQSSIQSGETIPKPKEKMWVQKLFEGQLTNEIKCLTCEKTTNRAESFMDLSLDIEQNSSVTSCLRQFSASEMLCHKDKFYCDECCGLQEAEKRMKIQVLPNILSLHLKRFKYQEALQKYVKLSYRVSFPLELRLFNTVDDMEDPDRIYDLNAFVVHVGSGPHHGHYVAVVKHQDRWLLFDDDTVESIDEADIHKYFGDSSQLGSGYVLFYQARDLDMSTIAPMQWAQQQLQQQHLSIPASLKNGATTAGQGSNGLGPNDLDQYGGLLPHHQQQELIHQQLAASGRQPPTPPSSLSLYTSQQPYPPPTPAIPQQYHQHSNQQQQGTGSLSGGGFSAMFNTPHSGTTAHLSNGPRSPTQIQDPSMLNGQRITSGSYVYTNGVVAGATGQQPQYASTNGYHGGSSEPPSPRSYGFSQQQQQQPSSLNSHGPSSSNGYGTPVSQHHSSKSSSGSSPGSGVHATVDPAKLKRAQSTPRITLASAAKSFGASGGKSFIGSLRGGS